MIARFWDGKIRAADAERYLAYLDETGLGDYANTPGHRGTTVLRRVQDGVAELRLVTLWDSMDAVREFAGDEPERARYYARDEEFLLELGEHVQHYEVLRGSLND